MIDRPTEDLIVTLEGDDPSAAFGQMMSTTDAFMTWFIGRAAVCDMRGAPQEGPKPRGLRLNDSSLS